MNQGILVDESEEFQDYRRTVAAKRSTRDKARIRAETNTLKLAEGGKPVALHGLAMFQDRACNVPDSFIVGLGMTLSCNRIGADAFIAADPSQPGERTLLAAVLKGGVIVSKEFLMNNGKGASIKYKRALASRRNVWISERFKDTHAAAAKIITDTNEANSAHIFLLAITDRIQQHATLITHISNKHNTHTRDTNTLTGDAGEVEYVGHRGRVHRKKNCRRAEERQALVYARPGDEEGTGSEGR